MMSRSTQNVQRAFFAIALLLWPAWVSAGEGAKVPEETAAQVRQAIESHVKKDMALKESFLLIDPQTEKPMSLTFDHVHQGVSKVNGEYVACVDFQRGETIYDVDFFVRPQDGGWEVSRLGVHKVDGKEVKRSRDDS
jgi:hypothetical protein